MSASKVCSSKCLHQTSADLGVDILSPSRMSPVLSICLLLIVEHCSLLQSGEIFIPSLYGHNKHLSSLLHRYIQHSAVMQTLRNALYPALLRFIVFFMNLNVCLSKRCITLGFCQPQ